MKDARTTVHVPVLGSIQAQGLADGHEELRNRLIERNRFGQNAHRGVMGRQSPLRLFPRGDVGLNADDRSELISIWPLATTCRVSVAPGRSQTKVIGKLMIVAPRMIAVHTWNPGKELPNVSSHGGSHLIGSARLEGSIEGPGLSKEASHLRCAFSSPRASPVATCTLPI
jgi:hypothetical protein